MSDEHLRDLERRWKETGSVCDEAQYLVERLRVGKLSAARLSLAAGLAHQAARRAMGVGDGEARTDLSAATESLLAIEPRLALDSVRLVIETVLGEFREVDPEAQEALGAVKEWINDPTDARVRAVAVAGESAAQAARRRFLARRGQDDGASTAAAALLAMGVHQLSDIPSALETIRDAARQARLPTSCLEAAAVRVARLLLGHAEDSPQLNSDF